MKPTNVCEYAIVIERQNNWTNVLLDKFLTTTKVNRFYNLEEAINWSNQKNIEQLNINIE